MIMNDVNKEKSESWWISGAIESIRIQENESIKGKN
jgi:hypothetical protein